MARISTRCCFVIERIATVSLLAVQPALDEQGTLMIAIPGGILRAAPLLPSLLTSHPDLQPPCDFDPGRAGPAAASDLQHDSGDLRHVLVSPAVENLLNLALNRAA